MLPDDLVRDAKQKADKLREILEPFGCTYDVAGYWERGVPLNFHWLDEWWYGPRPWERPPQQKENAEDDRMWYWDRGLARAIELQTGSHAAYECPLKPIEAV